MITYCAFLLSAALVLPKCEAALTASTPSWWPVAVDGDAVLSSTQTPASAPPVGYPTCWVLPAGQICVPAATPWQYWVKTPDHSSLFVPRPLKNSWSYGASPLGSPDSVTSPLALVLCVP